MPLELLRAADVAAGDAGVHALDCSRPSARPLSGPAGCSARVASMLTTTPRLRPLLGARPSPASFSSPLGRTSATTAMTLAVPMSSPRRRLCILLPYQSLPFSVLVRCPTFVSHRPLGACSMLRPVLLFLMPSPLAHGRGAGCVCTHRGHAPGRRSAAPAWRRSADSSASTRRPYCAGHLGGFAHKPLRALHHFLGRAAAQFHHSLAVEGGAPAAPPCQLPALPHPAQAAGNTGSSSRTSAAPRPRVPAGSCRRGRPLPAHIAHIRLEDFRPGC